VPHVVRHALALALRRLPGECVPRFRYEPVLERSHLGAVAGAGAPKARFVVGG